jgi:hypothetical protein
VRTLLPEVDDEPPEVVAAILASWSIDEITQLIEEIEAEIVRKMN